MAALLSRADQHKLDALFAELQAQTANFVGYPCNLDFVDYSDLHRFLGLPLNNVGDPYGGSLIRINTRALEREVLAWFAELYHAPADGFWGYVNNGGTEGNMYGMYLARELFPDGIVYFSQDTHYSVSKIMRVLGMRHIMVRSQPNGEMDYADLEESIRIHRDAPPILFCNIGTTMKEAVDDVGRIRQMLKRFALTRFYIHADAALAGMTLPFLAGAPVFDFRAGIDSLSVSGHKFVGMPMPSGVVLAKKGYVDRIARSIEYVGALDTTLTGSRNSLSPLMLWFAIRARGHEGFLQQVAGCRAMAEWAVQRFNEAGLPAWRNPHAITVVIPRPSDEVLGRWQMAVQEDYAHVICMPHITRQHVEGLIADMLAHPHPTLAPSLAHA